MAPLFSLMFEKFGKRFAAKATDSAVEGVKESLNDKLDQYSGIIKIGLVLGVIIFGGRQLIKTEDKRNVNVAPLHLPQANGYSGGYSGQPIVINNYYREHDFSSERGVYYGRQSAGNQRKEASYQPRGSYQKR